MCIKMSENKRFCMVIEDSEGNFHYLDNLTKKRIKSTLELENMLNDLWKQTQRFEKHNKDLIKENEQLRKEGKHWVYADADCGNGCHNCSHEKGGICEILSCGTHSYIKGVSECGLKYWELKE